MKSMKGQQGFFGARDFTQAPLDQPLASALVANPLDWGTWTYAGGFRLSPATQTFPGSPDFQFGGARSAMSICADRTKMWMGCRIAGQPMGWTQISIPTLNPALDFANMPVVSAIQGIATVLDTATRNNGAGNSPDRLKFCIEHDGMLIGGAQHSYEGDQDSNYLMWRVEDASDLAGSTIGGYYEVSGFTAHGRECAPNHYGEIPTEWQSLLGGNTHYACGSGDYNRVADYDSDGPSFWLVDLDQVTAPTPGTIAFTQILNFVGSLEQGFHMNAHADKIGVFGWDADITYREPRVWKAADYNDVRYNMYQRKQDPPYEPAGQASAAWNVNWPYQGDVIGNDLWINHSRTGPAFIIPGTRTFAVFGKIDGSVNGAGYRFRDDIGHTGDGPMPYVNSDRQNRAWFFDMRDIVDVYNGVKTSGEIVPHWYGNAPNPYEGQYPTGHGGEDSGEVCGGAWDPDNQRLYLLILSYDSSKPLIVAYDYTP